MMNTRSFRSNAEYRQIMGRGHNPQSRHNRNQRSTPVFLEVSAGSPCGFTRGNITGRPEFRYHSLFRQDRTMRVRVDREADAVYVNLTDRAIKDSAEVADGIVVDYDDEGRIVGVEILDASKRTDDPTTLTQFNLDLPKAG